MPRRSQGMSGWRVGYIAYPGQQLLGYDLGAQLLKVQGKVCRRLREH